MQVWTNLLDNAVKYSGDSVHLTIDIQEVDDAVRVTIADNGLGMSEEDQRHIFEQFYHNRTPECRDLLYQLGRGIPENGTVCTP